jgi:hypothetical protein
MRLFSIPAIVLGIALAIVFFEVYGLVSRPSVPKPIAFVVDQFAPGVELGARVSDARHSVAAMTYVPHLGFVGLPGSREHNLPDGDALPFVQVRLLLDERTRERPRVDPAKARIDAVEVVTARAGALSELAGAFTTVFHRAPRDGCIRTADPGHLREVHTWMTPNERAGLAVVSDFGAEDRVGAPIMTSVVAFTGKFQGSRTLRANYVDAPCRDVLESAPDNSSTIARAVAASESLTVALSDSLAPSLGFGVVQAGEPAESLDACYDRVDGHDWPSVVSNVVELQLPPGFRSTGESGKSARWSGGGGWIKASAHVGDAHVGWTGLITSECNVYVSGAPTHIDLVTTTYGRGVHALIQPSDAPAIGIEGMGKTVSDQAELLHAVRYARVAVQWGR